MTLATWGIKAVDYVKFIRTFKDRIFHAHMKDVWWGHGDGTVGIFGGHVVLVMPDVLGILEV